jgi:vitamin B12 transporter
VAGSTDYTVDSRDDTALFAQYVAEAGRWRVEGSVRGDDNEQFGRHGTGSAALGYALGNGLQLLAQYGTGFRAPSFNDLYYPPDPVFGPASNPLLEPERSRSLELALRGRVAAARWRLSLFDTHIRDLIGYDVNFLPANIDAARIRGLESTATVPWHDWSLDTGFTLQDAENRSDGPNRGNRLARRPRLTGHADVTRKLGAWSLGARWSGEGDRYDDAAGTRRSGGYGVLDLRAEAPLGTDWRLQLRAANLLDKRYETIAFYNQPGRAWYATLRYTPGR